ncbi:MAG TPA: hypothetical protein VK050_07050 [Flavobacteriaceae bacterium]|nr:hypothetical protein [Flavobacteriaceae bacterium]
MKRILYIISSLYFMQIGSAYAQIPRFVPNPADNKPVDWSNPADLILYFVLPIIFIILGLVSWKFRKKHNI